MNLTLPSQFRLATIDMILAHKELRIRMPTRKVLLMYFKRPLTMFRATVFLESNRFDQSGCENKALFPDRAESIRQ